jgi:hypothetical protein
MIKKLKYKFILINMILITIVLGSIFVTVYVSTQQRLVGDSMKTLQNAIMEDRGGGADHKPIFGVKDDPGFMHIPTFVVSLDKNNNIINDGKFIFIIDRTKEYAVTFTTKDKTESIVLSFNSNAGSIILVDNVILTLVGS